MRIAVLHFAHETVTFLGNDTTLADFRYPGSPAAGDAPRPVVPTKNILLRTRLAQDLRGRHNSQKSVTVSALVY